MNGGVVETEGQRCIEIEDLLQLSAYSADKRTSYLPRLARLRRLAPQHAEAASSRAGMHLPRMQEVLPLVYLLQKSGERPTNRAGEKDANSLVWFLTPGSQALGYDRGAMDQASQ